MKRLASLTLLAGVFGLSVLAHLAHTAHAELRPEKIYLADLKKTKAYIKDGLITGGDQSINEFVIKDIRRAPNSGFERIVIDLEGNRNGDSVAIPRSPYFQVAVTPDEKRLVFTLFGRPGLEIDAKKVLNSFKKSAVIEHLNLFPLIDETSWTFAFDMKGGHPVEIFELSKPTRIIVDIQIGLNSQNSKAKK
jgi:hypothetical protein